MENEKGQGVSHASDSQVPQKLQEKVPAELEHELPDVSTCYKGEFMTGESANAALLGYS